MSKQTPMTVESFMAFMEILQVDTEGGIMEWAREFGMDTNHPMLLRFLHNGRVMNFMTNICGNRVSVPGIHNGYEVPHDKPTNP